MVVSLPSGGCGAGGNYVVVVVHVWGGGGGVDVVSAPLADVFSFTRGGEEADAR